MKTFLLSTDNELNYLKKDSEDMFYLYQSSYYFFSIFKIISDL